MPLSNAPRDYDWGSTTLIADLEGRAPSGRPEAEVWFGDHPGSPAARARRADARRVARRRGRAAGAPARLPYLLKLLAAASPLSIQAHPSRAQADRGVRARGGRRHPPRRGRAHLPRREPQARAHRRGQRHVHAPSPASATSTTTRRLRRRAGAGAATALAERLAGAGCRGRAPRHDRVAAVRRRRGRRRRDRRRRGRRRRRRSSPRELDLVAAPGRRGLPGRPRHRRRAADEPRDAAPRRRRCSCPAGVLHAYLEGPRRRDHGGERQRAARRPHPQAHRRRRAAARCSTRRPVRCRSLRPRSRRPACRASRPTSPTSPCCARVVQPRRSGSTCRSTGSRSRSPRRAR